MKDFERWGTLYRLLNRGALAFVDLAFAASVLKKMASGEEEHAALLSVLFALSRQGHLTLDISQEALSFALKLLEVDDVEALAELVRRGSATFPKQGIANAPEGRPDAWVCRLDNYFYLQKNWVYESEVLAHLGRLSKSPPTIVFSEWSSDARLNAAQKIAVERGVQNSLSFLTGGPGTGKTFTAAELVKTCLSSLPPDQQRHFRIILTAPTGKAVAQLEGNLKQAIGEGVRVRSATLHSILGIRPHAREEEAQPLFADLIIADECSMIDAKIFSRLLASAQSGSRLILIGDKDQLPPVEAGSVFADLLDSGIFPATQLTESLRSDRMEILSLAKSIREGSSEEALAFLLANDDIEWVDLEEGKKSVSQIYAYLWECCKERFPSSFLEKPAPEQILGKLGAFSILSCMRQGPLGVDAVNSYFLNQYLRQAVQGTWWAVPFMITRNDHELQLFNGDLGFVVRKVGADFSLRQFHIDDYALFHDRRGGFRQISALALGSFEYSYCLSVHKSQGSEYDQALVLVPDGSEQFGREVLYTAVTRAKSKVSLAGSQAVIRQAIAASSRKKSGIGIRLKRD